MTEQEIVQAAKTNWLAWQGLKELQPEVAAWMEAHKKDCGYYDAEDDNVIDIGDLNLDCKCEIYRLRPDYEPEPKAGWREYEVTERNGAYMVVGLIGAPISLVKCAGRVGFGGVQFEGCKEWSMQIACYISGQRLHLYNNNEVEAQLAVPVKVRFWETK